MLLLPATPITSTGPSEAGYDRSPRPLTPDALPDLSNTDSVRAPDSAKVTDADGNSSQGGNSVGDDVGTDLGAELSEKLDLTLLRDADDDPADDEDAPLVPGAPKPHRIGQKVFRSRVSAPAQQLAELELALNLGVGHRSCGCIGRCAPPPR